MLPTTSQRKRIPAVISVVRTGISGTFSEEKRLTFARAKRSAQALAALLAMVALLQPAAAYNPPVDKVGPVTVRIEGPQLIQRPDEPVQVAVVIENHRDAPLDVQLHMAVIDSWRIEPGNRSVSVPAKGSSRQEFTLTPASPTYVGHYPIHAFARFELDGQQHEAHPILVVETKVPPLPRPAYVPPWKPFTLPDGGQLALWQLPVRRAVLQVFGKPPQVMPLGWHSGEEPTRAFVGIEEPVLGGQQRPAIGMHPPWFDHQVGTIYCEFPLQLPAGKPIRLRFANAISADGKGDGVTFRVRVASIDSPEGTFGDVLFQRHTAEKTWQPAEVDLSQYAGKTIRLQLESHPGPKNDTGWDHCYWAEPTIYCGAPPQPAAFPPTSTAGSVVLGKLDGGYSVRYWPGRRGLLDAVVGFELQGRLVCLRGFEARVLGSRLDDPRSPIVLLETKDQPIEGGLRVLHRFQSYRGPFDLIGQLKVESGVLRAAFRLEGTPQPQPWNVVYLEDICTGPWSHKAQRVYAGHGNVVCNPGDFTLGFDGHRLATSFVGMDFEDRFSIVQAVDTPPDRFEVRPSQRHYSLHVPHRVEMTFIASDNAFQAARKWRQVNGLKPSAGVAKLAGRFVFDLWGGRYGESRAALERAFRYGLTDAAVLWHNWQRWGYDYRLPDIVPPNPQFGTLEEMQQLIAACRRAGVLFAPHDNYIDFYPDAEGFSYQKHIAFDRNRQPVKAWLNESRGARSYRFRADSVEPFLRRNLAWIRQHMRPDAYFIDVWSSINPYDYWTADGRFFDRIYTRTSWGQHFAWIRDWLGDNAPQISESGHDQLIGWLDGATANHLRVGQPLPGRYAWSVWNWRCDDAQRTVWFDVAHHDRFILHGAGYSSRYEAGLDGRLHGIYSDDYITTEVLTGHPAMVSMPFGRDVVRKYWLTQPLMRALALRTIEAVEFVEGNIHRQRVVWSGGGEVFVNRGQSDWTIEGHALPQYGFFAQVRLRDGDGVVAAAIERRDGVIVEWCRTPQSLYVNGRALVGDQVRRGKPGAAEPSAEWLARQNPDGKLIDFGGVATAGGCLVKFEERSIQVTPLPASGDRGFAVRLNLRQLGWRGPEPTHLEKIDHDGKRLELAAVQRDGEAIVIHCAGDVFACRLIAQ